MGIIFCVTQAQRPYNNQSVLSTGTIYKLGIVKNGIYQLNESFFQQIGLAYPIKTGSVTLFGNGSFLPTEKVTNEGYLDDVQTIPMHWVDGGDGQLDRGDYCVFYGDFSQQPTFDNNQYHFSENLYADTVYYFLKLNTFNNAFIPKQAFIPSANKQTNLYDEVILYENDWVNLLNSGKEWYGEEWNMRTANATERSFNFTSLTPAIGATHSIQSFFAVRSVAQPAVFTCKLNGNTIATQTVQAGSGGFLDVFAEKVNITASTVNNNNNWQLSIGFQSNNNNAQAWLDKLILTVKSTLQLSNGKSLFFRNSEVIEQQTATTYSLQNGSADWQIWDITKPSNPVIINTSINNNFLRFTDSSNSLKQYVAFEKGSVLTPTILGKMNNQNLHAISNEVDYLIITHESLLPAANELANFHTQILQHKVLVVTTASIGNEFGSGICTPIGIRNFIKMLYDRRQQNQLKTSLTVCLLGAASFDYKKRIINNTSLVPCFETEESLSPLKSYTSDDFFTFLSDGDDINNYQQQPKMSIAVGRIPAAKLADAYKMVDKIKAYHQKLSVGNWRNKAVFIADDKDLNLHLTDAEWLAQQASETNSLINISKLYADAFPLVVTNNSPKFPALTQQFIQSFNNGSLFINYTGHGGFQQLADEGIFTFNELPLLNNANKLPLVITATCDFAPFDDPTKQSLGNELLLKNNNGAIALLTTTRTVFAYSNRI
ncbi:MAG: type IX secretion system sortase PorU, partial [Chitinophagaceae bacterium]